MPWWMWLLTWWAASTVTVVVLFLIDGHDWAKHSNCRWNWAKLPLTLRRTITLFCYPGIFTFLAVAMLIQETIYRQKENAWTKM